MGVLNITTCQYFLLNLPEYFPIWYRVVIPLIMLSRLYHFRSLNWQYFMLDFCYFVLACTMINVTVLQENTRFFKICFIFATGALPVAIPIWRNSLIFHDYDKIVSVYIHILPCLLYYTLRWHLHCQADGGGSVGIIPQCPSLEVIDYVYATALYLLWQVLYILKTEVWDRRKLDQNPELLTSLRWLAKDTKNASARAVLRILRKIGLYGANEDYDSTTMKTKLVFVTSQLMLTVGSFLPSAVVYQSESIHLIYIVLIFTIAVFNGASFYIEVFSVRYHSYIEQLEKMKGIADAAKVVVHEIAAMSTPKGSSSRTFPSDKAKSNKNEDTNTSYGKNNGEASSSSSDEGKLTLAQISTELQRTEREVWEEMHEQTQAFYRAASASPLDRSPRCYGSIPLSSSNGELAVCSTSPVDTVLENKIKAKLSATLVREPPNSTIKSTHNLQIQRIEASEDK
eukprot:gene11335-12651_t